MAGFQTSVSRNLALGVAGDFATSGPYSTVPALSGELTAGPSGVTVGVFAWADDNTGVVTNGKPNLASTRFGFVGREQRSLITTFLGEASLAVNAGFGITLYDGGAYFITAPSGGGTIGQKVFAKYVDGTIVLGTAGSPPTTTGTIGTTNGSANITYTPASLTLNPGMPISGTGIPAGATVATVNAVAGTATLSANATATGSPTATVTTAYETRFFVKTAGVAGDILIISHMGF
ncbi:structural cement protein Gp24 [Novosphingobium olei]|uniref:Uncharacterized protein n=1 Tax=Novosphingobium olei TaxID=2728851 RepID=A0A7Y0BNR9_9SPHN|nr:hypothetical protein [Novosphingobium olei]NML93797.1 hypothetical protein [Novosphingobium olei]